MDSLKFELKSNIYPDENNILTIPTPWGFIHNIICSKMNNNNTPPCDTSSNHGYYPDFTITIDSEKTQASKDYIIGNLQNVLRDHTKRDEMIKELNKNIKDEITNNNIQNVNFVPELNYILEKSLVVVNPEKVNFRLVRTPGTNFDAAIDGNICTSINRLAKHTNNSNMFDISPSTYTYDISVNAGKINLLHLIYKPFITTGKTVGKPFGATELKLHNWFNDEQLNASGITHTVKNSNEGCGTGYSLSNAINNYNNNNYGNKVFDLHFKTLTDSGQIFCYSALQSHEKKTEAIYIFHTLDTFCGGIASLIVPGTVIERSDQIRQDKRYSEDMFIESLKSGPNNVYCARGIKEIKGIKGVMGTYDTAIGNIGFFQNISNLNLTNEHHRHITDLIKISANQKILFAEQYYKLNKLEKQNRTQEATLARIRAPKRNIDICPVGFVRQCVPDIKTRKRSNYSSNDNPSKRSRYGGNKTLKKKVGKKTLKKKLVKKLKKKVGKKTKKKSW
jgi:hypothetical protein